MKTGGRGLMNVCYDRYDPKKSPKNRTAQKSGKKVK
jgi:hypothetical protein